MSDWRLLRTRPAEESQILAATLAAHGVFSSSLPLLAIEPLAATPEQRAVLQQLQHYTAVIVVSKPAARLLCQRLPQGWSQPAAQQWLAVGAATAQVLGARVANVSWPETGEDSEGLLQLPSLLEALQIAQPRVLIVKGEGGRELLAQHLRTRGVSVDYLSLYQRTLPHYTAGAVLARVRDEQLNGLLISSGQGLEHLLKLAADDWSQLARLTLFVPSARVAALARAAGAQCVVDCHGASAMALLAALDADTVPAQ